MVPVYSPGTTQTAPIPTSALSNRSGPSQNKTPPAKTSARKEPSPGITNKPDPHQRKTLPSQSASPTTMPSNPAFIFTGTLHYTNHTHARSPFARGEHRAQSRTILMACSPLYREKYFEFLTGGMIPAGTPGRTGPLISLFPPHGTNSAVTMAADL
jgi:hypothetical protein